MKYKFTSIIIIFSLIVVIPIANAQLTLGGEASQESIEVKMNIEGEVSVKHVVRASNAGQTLLLFPNAIIPDRDYNGLNEIGNEVQLGIIDDGLGNKSVYILPSKYNTIIEYNLENITLKDNLFNTKISYHEKYSILFDQSIRLIFLNNNIIFLDDKKGIAINGGGNVNIKFYENESKIIKETIWEENKFDVEIITDSEIESFNFNQPEKSISFQVNDEDKFVTVIMSEELLGGPYIVLLNNEKVQYSKFTQAGTISLSLKPETTGEITIIGTTVIPEFSMFIPLIMGFFIILTIPMMKRFNLH
ncbi:hypothetical protein OAR84_00845 [Nitrosopumilus sp.]|nr:hypothetical protein [Nitrosopumilus sp.]